MRISYDPAANAAYLHLTDQPFAPGGRPHHHPGPTPARALTGFDALDWKDARLVGIEILDASIHISRDVLEQADQPA